MNIFSKLLSLILVDPKLMMLGREVTLPLQAVIGTPQQNNDEPEVGRYVQDLQNRLETAHDLYN
jgi:hypothetical protein